MTSSQELTSGFYDDEPTPWFPCLSLSPFFSLFGSKCTWASWLPSLIWLIKEINIKLVRFSSANQRDETAVPSIDRATMPNLTQARVHQGLPRSPPRMYEPQRRLSIGKLTWHRSCMERGLVHAATRTGGTTLSCQLIFQAANEGPRNLLPGGKVLRLASTLENFSG